MYTTTHFGTESPLSMLNIIQPLWLLSTKNIYHHTKYIFTQYTYILENVIYAAALTNNDDEKKDTLHAYLAPQGVKFFV